MKINLSNFETSDVSLFDVSIVQRDVGGGKTEKEDIDCLEEYPTAKSFEFGGKVNCLIFPLHTTESNS